MATTGTPQPGNLADAGTAAMAQIEQHVRMLGELAARQTIANQQGAAPGDVGNVTMRSMPAIPAPIVAGQHINNGQLPLEGGGSDNYGERVAADKTRLVNQLNQAATTALANKKEKDIAQKQREYEIIMTAMQGVNSPDPAVAQHNKDLLNHFFDGPDGDKRAKAISKAMGFDAFDMKKEQKKQEDPDYQAIQKAKQTVGSGSVAPNNGQLVPGGAPVADPNVEPMGTMPQAAAPQTQSGVKLQQFDSTGLNPTAQAFLKNMPMTTSAPQYLPSSKQMGRVWEVTNKIAPDANEALKAQTTTMDLQSKELININDKMTDRDVETMKARTAALDTWTKGQTAYKVALLEHGDAARANDIKALDLQLKSKELDQKDKYQSLDVAKNLVDAHQKNVQSSMLQVNELRQAYDAAVKNGSFKNADAKKAAEKEINDKKADLSSVMQGYYAASKTYMDLAGQGGISVGDSGQGAGQRAVESFDKSSGKPNGSSQPNSIAAAPNAPVRSGNIDLSKPNIQIIGKDGKPQDIVPNK